MTESDRRAVAATERGPYGAAASDIALRERFRNGAFPVGVYGLGKMGLPLAGVYADTCGNVIGADIDEEVVATVNAGGSHVKREPGLDGLVEEVVEDGSFSATTDPREAARQASIHVVIVPTPITDEKEPDLAILSTVVEDIGRGLDAGDMVIIESTVPPRTTVDNVLPMLSMASGLSNDEFGLAFCPERTSSGRALEDIRGAYPKVVGGVDEESTTVATAIYEEINAKGVYAVSDSTTAEAVKVFEGLYRDVNIALANELATFTDELGIDVREAIEIANTQPFCEIHDPGPGVGGHCIPWYPYFMIEPFATEAPLLRTARLVNDGMPRYTVETLERELQVGGKDLADSNVLILGLTYRPGVEEIRASPSLDIAEELTNNGAAVYGVDPMLDSAEEFALEQIGQDSIYEQAFDGIILATPHEEFATIRWDELSASSGDVVVIDGRDALDVDEVPGVRFITLGGD